MQDISLLPEWSREDVLKSLQEKPLDHKTMKSKLERIYQISSYNELEYMPDVLDAYCWIRLANELPSEQFAKFFPSEKNEKEFYEEFVSTAIRYMIICRKFKHKVMMVLTQYIMAEGLRLFVKKLDCLEKYLKMINVLNYTFDTDKQFYRLNYAVESTERIMSHRSISEVVLDDSKDLENDPEMKQRFVHRVDICPSKLFMDLLYFAHDETDLFGKILVSVTERRFNIEATSELISFLMHVHPFFHRQWALEYIPKLTQGVLDFVYKGDDITIRNFSKERYEAVISSVREFLKRVKTQEERKQIVEHFQLNLICRFLFSDFLDRKLQAVSILTTFMKYSKNSLVKSKGEFVEWIREKQILKAIYNEKSHEELIGRSSEFLQYYLLQKPSVEELQPLLELTDANLKLIAENFEYFPQEFQVAVVGKVKEKPNISNKDALTIMKQVTGCEEWLLQNGGECWVEVVREKTKRKADIAQVFNHGFPVVWKITKEVAELYEGKFKTEFFLYMNEINYVSTVLDSADIPFADRVRFTALALDPLSQVSDTTYKSILPYIPQVNDSLPKDQQMFFVVLLDKLSKPNLRDLFATNFTSSDHLSQMTLGQMAIFRRAFLLINEEEKKISKKVTYSYVSPHSYRKEKKEHLTVAVNPNDLTGMQNLMTVIFENKDIEVSQAALQFIGFLFDRLSAELIDSVSEFKSKILDSCLQEFYKTEDQQEKYLRIIEKLMNESEKEGVDQEPSVNALFPSQKMTVRVIDHFNVNKSRITLEVPSNLTLYEFRAHVGRAINAYVHEMKILQNDREIDPRLNGHMIHNLNLASEDLVIEKKVSIEKVSLCDSEGALNDKARKVLIGMFREYSTQGMMSKPQCQKYQQRCIGEVTSLSESRVDKIYDQYDTDKDGYLTEEDFLKFYEASVRTRESAVWSNLETFGVRNDLEILEDLEIDYPDGALLTRNLLFKNEKFMDKLLALLQNGKEPSTAKAAWSIVSRLPLARRPQESIDISSGSVYAFRYWLYVVEAEKQHSLIGKGVLRRILESDIETTCIGLRLAQECSEFDVEVFNLTLSNIRKISSLPALGFFEKVLLDNSLRLFESCLRRNAEIRAVFVEKEGHYDEILVGGLMSPNPDIRAMYCKVVADMVQLTVEEDFALFRIFFSLVYRNFDECDKATLTIEYFDLYSQLLELLQGHAQLQQKLGLNEQMLAQSVVELYKAHQCTEASLNSRPDHVAQGFLRVLSKLLSARTKQTMVPFVQYLFQHSLFPEHGHNKLKNSKSRKDAYELLYEICNLKGEKGESRGLEQLFAAGFKKVYKKMNQNKPTSFSFSSYYSNYNEARSELGYAGIRNLGCICYMIAMLQQLFMTRPFRYLTLMAEDGEPECLVKKGSKEVDDNLFHQLQSLFAHLELTEKQEYNPDELCFSFKDFEGQPVNVTIQQDAQEFINLFFDKMEWSLKKTPFRRIFEDVYGGRNCNQTVCSNCQAVKERFENFYPLSLEIKGFRNIEESFAKYITGEVISDYQCDFCNKKTDVTKSCYLAETPNYFIVHLTRMCFNYDKFENEKVNSRWEFPHNLNVWQYSLDKQKGIADTKDDFEYQLKGIVLHYGTADFGHYFSYIKESENLWIEFNDERVREFDPRDIESDCFGGENWRRESQSAYLCVYEKVKKRPIVLEFQSEEQKDATVSKFNLKNAVIEKQEQQGNQSAKVEEQESKIEDKEVKEKETETQIAAKQEGKVEEKPKVLLELDPMKIGQYVPQPLKEKISKSNEEFSFSLNLSNDEFAYFLFKILSIQPPEELITEYLELCYECFHLKQVVCDEEEVETSLSEWAAKRFKEIVSGHGWEFLKNFGRNWESDILNSEKATRVGIKNLLECVITDIIQSNSLNSELEDVQEGGESSEAAALKAQKREIILEFLDKYAAMMENEVPKHWHRFKEYFEVWTALVEENGFVRRYCEEKMMVEKILDFILEDDSPFTRTKKRYSMGNNYYSAEFECPLEFMTLLIRHGYELNEMEEKCMKYYAFMSKVINFQTQHFNIIEHLCAEDSVLSEKMAYLILSEAARVNQSDGIKPIVAVVHKFLAIDDSLAPLRREWILGIPQPMENSRTASYGVYGVNVDQEYILTFFSPVRASPLLLQLIRFKSKAQHVAALLLSMLLQLEADGLIDNLERYPSMEAFENNYTYWFEEFVDSYYEDTHRPYMSKHYIEYGNRLKALWTERPHRNFDRSPFYLVGKSLEKNLVDEVHCGENEIVEIKLFDVVSELLPYEGQVPEVASRKTLKNFEGSEHFRFKTNTSSIGHTSLMAHDRGLNSSDEEEGESKKGPIANPLEARFQGNLYRKCVVKNLSTENLLLTMKIHCKEGDANCELPVSPVSFEIKSEAYQTITLKKKDVEKPFGKFEFEVSIIGKATREGFWPRQIITPVVDEERAPAAASNDKIDSDEDSNEDWQ